MEHSKVRPITRLFDAFEQLDQHHPGKDREEPLQRPQPARYQTETPEEQHQGIPLQSLQLIAAGGDAKANLELGNRYRKGDGVPMDLVAAWNHYVSAARSGSLEAMTNIGVMYDQGQTVPADPATACRCYRHAAERGFAVAQYNLAIMYADGLGVERDQALALAWFRAAAQKGYQPAIEACDWLEELMPST